MTDPIADMLTQIRNASAVKKQEVVLKFSKMKYAVAKVLVEEGYIVSVVNDKESELFPHGALRIALKYTPEGRPVIHHVGRVSKPGQRVYASSQELPRILQGMGVAIVSTSRGIMTDRTARKQHVGGEVVCSIW